MPSDKLTDWVRDIVEAIGKIRQWTEQEGGVTQVLRPGSMSCSAVERQLLIVSEAAIRIHHAESTYLAEKAPEIDWPGVRGIGNFIRHRYNKMDFDLVEQVLETYLDPLEAACLRLLA